MMKDTSCNYQVSLGFAEKPRKGDFDYESFPSKIGGLPVWLFPPKDLDISFFECELCKGDLFFLLQLYCPLENNKDCFHRVQYLFFCKRCWKYNNAIKVLRQQLGEVSEYYNGDRLLNRKDFESDETIKAVNGKVKCLSNAFFIDSRDECDEATEFYENLYDKFDEKSIGSKNSFIQEDDDEDFKDCGDNEKIDRMIKDYYHDVEQTDEVIYSYHS
jgi:hypothetical protein